MGEFISKLQFWQRVIILHTSKTLFNGQSESEKKNIRTQVLKTVTSAETSVEDETPTV